LRRPTWDEYFISIANVVAERSTCLRSKFGAVIVTPEHQIVSTGYNGAPSGVISCLDRNVCYRQEHNIPSGTQYETCFSVHAEANALIRSLHNVRGCMLYIGNNNFYAPCHSGRINNNPCFMCRRMIKNAGITHCAYEDEHGVIVKEDLSMIVMKDLRANNNKEE
jgi:dCMP deaminase